MKLCVYKIFEDPNLPSHLRIPNLFIGKETSERRVHRLFCLSVCLESKSHSLWGNCFSCFCWGKQHKRHIRKREHKGLHQLSLSPFFSVSQMLASLFLPPKHQLKTSFCLSPCQITMIDDVKAFATFFSPSLSPLDSLTILTPLSSECKCD